LSGRKNEYELKEIDPYADNGNTPDNNNFGDRSSDLPVNHNNINLNNFGHAGFASQKSDDPAMYSQKQNQSSVQLQKGTCYTPGCTAIRRIFNVLGCMLAIGNSAFDFLYPIKSPYYTKLLYFVTIVALIFRMAVNFGLS